MCGGFTVLFSQSQTQPAEAGLSQSRHNLSHWFLSNGGRITSYMIAGAIAGTLGGAASHLFNPVYAQNFSLMLAGGFMVALGLYIAGWWQGLTHIEKLGGGLWRKIQPLLSSLLSERSWGKSLLVGIIWGWLPCGLVYSMLVWSMTIANPLGGAAIMLAFGMGTLPMLMGLAILSEQLDRFRRNKTIRQLLGSIIICFGLLTLLGMVRPVHLMFPNPFTPGVAPAMHHDSSMPDTATE